MKLTQNFQTNSRVLFQHLVGVTGSFPPPQESVTSLCHNGRYREGGLLYDSPFFFKPIFFIFSLKHKTDISKVFFVLVRLRSSGPGWLAQTRFSGPQLAGGPGFPR